MYRGPATAAGSGAEFALLCRCAHKRLSAEDLGEVEQMLEGIVDWDEIVRRAQFQGTMPLLHHSLAALRPGVVPEAILNRLSSHAALNLALNQALAAELTRLVELLSRHEIRALPFKGPVLAEAAYGSLALRKAGDLDLLIGREDAVRAIALFEAAGYIIETPLPLTEALDELHFRRGDGRIIVELRWRVASKYFVNRLDFDLFWARRQNESLLGRIVPGLPREEVLIILCAHGCRHAWGRLMWVCDIHELIRASPNLDWRRLWRLAKGWGFGRPVALGLRLAQDLLGLPIPAAFQSRVGGRVVSRCAHAVEDQLATGRPHEDLPLFHSPMLDSFPHRIRRRLEWLGRRIRPTAKDRQLLRLPQPLHFLYYLLRPARLLAEHCVGPAPTKPPA